jgi:hypothetical protein
MYTALCRIFVIGRIFGSIFLPNIRFRPKQTNPFLVDHYPEAFDTITAASLLDDMADSRPSVQQIKLLIDQLTAFFPKHCSMHI